MKGTVALVGWLRVAGFGVYKVWGTPPCLLFWERKNCKRDASYPFLPHTLILKIDSKLIAQEEKDRGCSRCCWRRRTSSWGPSTPTPCSPSSSAPSVSTISPLPSNSAPRWRTKLLIMLTTEQLYPGSPGLHRLLPPVASLSDMSIPNGRGEELGDGAGKKWSTDLWKLCHFNNCQVSRLLKFPCRYHPMGCKEAHSLSAKAEHERNCPYLQLKCPFHGQCSFGGALSAVVPHLKSEHAVTPVPGRLHFPQNNGFNQPCPSSSATLWNPLLPRKVLLQEKPVELHLWVGQEPVPVHGEAHPLLHRRPPWELQHAGRPHTVHW